MTNMKKYGLVVILILIGLLVLAIGGFAGWVVVLHTKGQTISWQDAARGFGFGTPTAGQNGSTYNNIGGGAGGGSFSAGGGTGAGYGGAGSTGMITGYREDGTPIYGVTASGADATSTVNLSYGSSTTSTVVVPKTPRLWHITKTPVAGFAFSTSAPMVFFSERATGYIFTADAISGDILRRTNTLMPKTYEAYFARDGAVIYRTVNDTTGGVQTFSGIMGSSTSSNLGALMGVNLRNNILAISANPDSKTVFFIIEDSGTFSGFTAPWIEGKSGKEKLIFSSPIASWMPYALSDGRLIIAEKPQDDAAGYAYEVAPDGTLKPLIRGAPGLTILPLANSSAFIFGTSANGALTLFAQTSTTTLALPVRTVADKCVWAPFRPATTKKVASHLVVYCAVPSSVSAKNFLESWYMGALHTSDSWWRLDLTTGETAQVLSADTGGSALDVIDPAIDPTGNFLGFKNNADGSLWVLRINK